MTSSAVTKFEMESSDEESRTLYCGNLDTKVDEELLHELFIQVIFCLCSQHTFFLVFLVLLSFTGKRVRINRYMYACIHILSSIEEHLLNESGVIKDL